MPALGFNYFQGVLVGRTVHIVVHFLFCYFYQVFFRLVGRMLPIFGSLGFVRLIGGVLFRLDGRIWF